MHPPWNTVSHALVVAMHVGRACLTADAWAHSQHDPMQTMPQRCGATVVAHNIPLNVGMHPAWAVAGGDIDKSWCHRVSQDTSRLALGTMLC
jgi:hypothetical protein